MNAETPAYGLWSLVIINSVVFILFAYSFFKPRTGRIGDRSVRSARSWSRCLPKCTAFR